MANALPLPTTDAISTPRRTGLPPGQKDPQEGMVSQPWLNFFGQLSQASSASATNRATVTVTDSHASIGATSILPVPTNSGLYRITYYARITTVGTVTSSLTVSFAFTDHATSQSFSGAAITGNTITTFQTNTAMVYCDANAPITYATTYASNAADTMRYQLFVVVETVST